MTAVGCRVPRCAVVAATGPARSLMCARHWSMVSNGAALGVYRTWRPGLEDAAKWPRAYAAAVDAAVESVVALEANRRGQHTPVACAKCAAVLASYDDATMVVLRARAERRAALATCGACGQVHELRFVGDGVEGKACLL